MWLFTLDESRCLNYADIWNEYRLPRFPKFSRTMSREFLLQLLSLVSSKIGNSIKKCSHHDIQMFIVFFPNNLLILPIGHLVTLWNLSFNTPYLLGPICESSHRVNYLNSFIHLFIYLSTHHLFIHSSKTSVFIFLNFGWKAELLHYIFFKSPVDSLAYAI